MNTLRVLAALAFGGLASNALTPEFASVLWSTFGYRAAGLAALGVPFFIAGCAAVVVLLTYPFRGEPIPD